MGDKVEKPTSSPQQTITDYLNSLCAYALSIGMPYSTYWEDDPDILKIYIQAEEIRQRKRNNELWLQGAYVYNAIGSLSPLLNALSKDHKPQPYMKEPFPLTEDEITERRNKRALAFKERLMQKANKHTEEN